MLKVNGKQPSEDKKPRTIFEHVDRLVLTNLILVLTNYTENKVDGLVLTRTRVVRTTLADSEQNSIGDQKLQPNVQT
jgi:hypothetical protein